MRTLFTGLGTVVVAVAFAAPAGAATIAPTDLGDTGVNCTLREAVSSANADMDVGGCIATDLPYGDDIVDIGSSSYVLLGAPGDEDNLSGDLDVNDAGVTDGESLTIVGDGANTAVINSVLDADNDRTIHHIDGELTIQGVTLTNGRIDGDGASVYSTADENLTLDEVSVSDNEATNTTAGALGGGVSFQPSATAVLTITQSEFFDNHATASAAGAVARGGAILASGLGGSSAMIDDTRIRGNEAKVLTGADNSRGGGISASLPGDLIVTDSVIKDNTSVATDAGQANNGAGVNIDADAGRIYRSLVYNNSLSGGNADGAGINLNSGVLNVVNSTISGNQVLAVGAKGGGIRTTGTAGLIIQSTVADNFATAGGHAIDVVGGSVTVKGSILHSSPPTGTCSGVFLFGEYTLSTGSTCVLPGGAGNLQNIDTMTPLGMLTASGGPRAGLPITGLNDPLSLYEPTTAAIDRVPAALCHDDLGADLLVDQISETRPVDRDGDGMPECDSGARELQPLPPPALPPPATPSVSTPAATAAVLTPASATKKCKKGRKLRKGKCVKKKKKK